MIFIDFSGNAPSFLPTWAQAFPPLQASKRETLDMLASTMAVMEGPRVQPSRAAATVIARDGQKARFQLSRQAVSAKVCSVSMKTWSRDRGAL
jgi:hypothetical protein